MEPPNGSRVLRRVEDLTVLGLGRVQAIEAAPGVVVLDDAGQELLAVSDWLLSLRANDCTLHTVRAYAMSLLRFARFLWAVDCPLERATEVEVRDFVLWARQAKKFVGNKRPAGPRGQSNAVTGKHHAGLRYSAKTINHTLTVVHEYYAFHIERGRGPVVNPVPSGRSVTRIGDDADHQAALRRRGRLRQREPERTPRSLPDEQFDALFRKLACHRDRALVAFYVSSGVRASELLQLTGDRINYGDQLIRVTRKGGAEQWLPASPDAFIWLRLYQLERGTPSAHEPVWLTLRQPHRALTYDALRAVLNRANQALGSNWTTHDLRHTFAQRALDGGMGLHEVQELLGHVSLETTSIYTKPHMNEVIAHHRAALTRQPVPDATPMPAYDQADLDSVFGTS